MRSRRYLPHHVPDLLPGGGKGRFRGPSRACFQQQICRQKSMMHCSAFRTGEDWSSSTGSRVFIVLGVFRPRLALGKTSKRVPSGGGGRRRGGSARNCTYNDGFECPKAVKHHPLVPLNVHACGLPDRRRYAGSVDDWHLPARLEPPGALLGRQHRDPEQRFPSADGSPSGLGNGGAEPKLSWSQVPGRRVSGAISRMRRSTRARPNPARSACLGVNMARPGGGLSGTSI